MQKTNSKKISAGIYSRILFLSLFVFILSCNKNEINNNSTGKQSIPAHDGIIYHEFHYDWLYDDNTRYISAYKFADIPDLPEPLRKIIRDLIYDGLDFEEFSKDRMHPPGFGAYTDKGEYQFNFEEDYYDNPLFEKLRKEFWPDDAEDPVSDYLIFFISNDIVFFSNDFIIIKSNYQYDGAFSMHMQYGQIIYTIDLRNAKILDFDDVFLPETFNKLEITIRNLLDIQDISVFPSSDGGLPMPDDFLFEKNGVLFSWNPYVIASFASGTVSVLIPYQDIDRFLTDDGKGLATAVRISLK
jgi:hypothetical protein